MKRAVMGAVLVGILTVATPAIAATTDAGTTCGMVWSYGPGEVKGPDYSPNKIVVLDGIISTLSPAAQDDWRSIRRAALASWRQTGALTFRPQPYELPVQFGSDWVAAMYANVQPRTVVLGEDLGDTISGSGYGGWAPEGGYAVIDLDKGWRTSFWAPIYQGVLTHEIGHALGFGHGGNGVMCYGGKIKPNTTDLKKLDGYYR